MFAVHDSVNRMAAACEWLPHAGKPMYPQAFLQSRLKPEFVRLRHGAPCLGLCGAWRLRVGMGVIIIIPVIIQVFRPEALCFLRPNVNLVI